MSSTTTVYFCGQQTTQAFHALVLYLCAFTSDDRTNHYELLRETFNPDKLDLGTLVSNTINMTVVRMRELCLCTMFSFRNIYASVPGFNRPWNSIYPIACVDCKVVKDKVKDLLSFYKYREGFTVGGEGDDEVTFNASRAFNVHSHHPSVPRAIVRVMKQLKKYVENYNMEDGPLSPIFGRLRVPELGCHRATWDTGCKLGWQARLRGVISSLVPDLAAKDAVWADVGNRMGRVLDFLTDCAEGRRSDIRTFGDYDAELIRCGMVDNWKEFTHMTRVFGMFGVPEEKYSDVIAENPTIAFEHNGQKMEKELSVSLLRFSTLINSGFGYLVLTDLYNLIAVMMYGGVPDDVMMKPEDTVKMIDDFADILEGKVPSSLKTVPDAIFMDGEHDDMMSLVCLACVYDLRDSDKPFTGGQIVVQLPPVENGKTEEEMDIIRRYGDFFRRSGAHVFTDTDSKNAPAIVSHTPIYINI